MVYRRGYLRLLRGSLDHEILLGILAEKIHDQRFLRLIRNMLKAGYSKLGIPRHAQRLPARRHGFPDPQ